MDTRWKYFQYQKQHDYPLYIRFQPDDVSSKLEHLLKEFGFQELLYIEVKKISLQRPYTKILTVQNAGPRVQMQISGSDLLDKYGCETLSLQGGVPVYVYRKVGLLTVPAGKILWDLALSQDISLTDHLVGIRVILARFLAQAFAEQGILCYWGTIREGSIIVMKQGQSLGESIIIDFQKRLAFYPGGEVKLGSSLKLIRKDKEITVPGMMKREELISFMSVSTCLLSFSGITLAMKKSIYEISACTSGSYGHRELGMAA